MPPSFDGTLFIQNLVSDDSIGLLLSIDSSKFISCSVWLDDGFNVGIDNGFDAMIDLFMVE